MQSTRIENLGAPQNDNDAVRFADLNSAIEGFAWKDSCRVKSQANTNLASSPATIDGIALVSGDRVLIAAQSAPAENGIYVFTAAAAALTRALDASTAAELEQAVTTVEEGTNAGTTWRQTSVNFTLGSDAVAWTAFGTSAPPASETEAGVAELATQGEVDAGVDDARIVTPLKLAAWSGKAKRASGLIGDGVATQYDVTHGFGTRDVSVEVYRNSSAYDSVLCDVSRPDTNTVRLNFASAPALNAFKVVVIA